MSRRIWITGGGTREPIDDVRYVGNRSTGRLALALTAEALGRGHQVRLLLSESVRAPAPCSGLELSPYETSAELRMGLARDPGPDVLIHAAAVADYAPEPRAGKVPSGDERWTLTMVRQPKLIDEFRRLRPGCTLVMFKLESGIEAEELWQRARAGARRSGADLVFANLLGEVSAEGHAGWLVEPDSEGPPRRVEGRSEIAGALLDWIEVRENAS